jgi:hypothetical protein
MVSMTENVEEFMKLKKEISQKEFVKDIMNFLQLLCENCFLGFQVTFHH